MATLVLLLHHGAAKGEDCSGTTHEFHLAPTELRQNMDRKMGKRVPGTFPTIHLHAHPGKHHFFPLNGTLAHGLSTLTRC